MNLNCPFCNQEVDQKDIFCPHCGKQLPNKNLPFSIGQKIKIYLVSFFLTPFGMYWFFKYYKNPDYEKRKVAYYVLLITLFTLAAMAFLSAYTINMATHYASSYQLDPALYGL